VSQSSAGLPTAKLGGHLISVRIDFPRYTADQLREIARRLAREPRRPPDR
jgi:Cdc6-like AAA superfamily ATPase